MNDPIHPLAKPPATHRKIIEDIAFEANLIVLAVSLETEGAEARSEYLRTLEESGRSARLAADACRSMEDAIEQAAALALGNILQNSLQGIDELQAAVAENAAQLERMVKAKQRNRKSGTTLTLEVIDHLRQVRAAALEAAAIVHGGRVEVVKATLVPKNTSSANQNTQTPVRIH